MQCEEAKTELSDLKEKYEKTEQEKQSLTDELEECKANMRELQEKGTKVSAEDHTFSRKEKAFFFLNLYNYLTNNIFRGACSVEIIICKSS